MEHGPPPQHTHTHTHTTPQSHGAANLESWVVADQEWDLLPASV